MKTVVTRNVDCCFFSFIKSKTTKNAYSILHYKFQGQERQDELNLNWISFKYRNYDPAIGRFMSIDPLAEKYAYNSPYAFQENKIGLGRELEGLEMVSERSKDGKSVTITYKVKPVNNTAYADGSGNMLSDKDFNTLVQTRADQTEATMSGKTTNGENVTVNVEFCDDATITWEYNTMIDTEGTATGGDGVQKERAPGKTTEIGNTQKNRTQTNVYTTLDGKNAEVSLTPTGIEYSTNAGTHEDVHVGGGQHGDDIKDDSLRNKVNSDRNNTMYESGVYGGNQINNEQRTIILRNVEEQQP